MPSPISRWPRARWRRTGTSARSCWRFAIRKEPRCCERRHPLPALPACTSPRPGLRSDFRHGESMNATAADSDLVCLASDTKLEPLVFRWYAWGHLVSPVQLALPLPFRHLPMLKSFVANPAVHEAARKNPKMLGGSFLELGQGDLPAVRALQQDILTRGADLLGFAEDLIKLDRQLQKSETGFSLDHHYDALPASLAGLVEASYDLNHHPSLRVFEELIYRGELAGTAAQEIAFCKTPDAQRNFFINTPRLDGEDRFVVPLPFD